MSTVTALLIAQLVAPPLQNSPIRLPNTSPIRDSQKPSIQSPAKDQVQQDLDSEPPAVVPDRTQPQSKNILHNAPTVVGFNRYKTDELTKIFEKCRSIPDLSARLNACAATLTAQLVADGYVGSRVYVKDEASSLTLEVVEARIFEIRIQGPDARLNQKIARLIKGLKSNVLFIPKLENELQSIRSLPAVANLTASLSKLGSDPSQAVLRITVDPRFQSWQGDISIRNDGSTGSGEFRSSATILKQDLGIYDDVLLFYGEINTTDKPQLGSTIVSLSYTIPLVDSLSLTSAFGYSKRNLVELPSPSNKISTNQFQGLGQLEYILSESLSSRWSIFAGLSGNRGNTYFDGNPLPDSFPMSTKEPRSGYLRAGLSVSGNSSSLFWSGNTYVLQGIPAITPETQRKELNQLGIDPGKATAIGALISASWLIGPEWQWNGRVGGQVAVNPLTSSMQFTLGSDAGIKGLPGQLISGDNGWLFTNELVWTFWKKGRQAFQLIPFIGVGGVSTSIKNASFADTIGSAGLLARWLSGQQWAVEIGWSDQFNDSDNRTVWEDWALGSGLYAQLKYRF